MAVGPYDQRMAATSTAPPPAEAARRRTRTRAASTRPAPSIRRRLLLSTIGASTAAVLGFGIPLGVAAAHIERDRAVLRLGEQASTVLAQVPDDILMTAAGTALPALGTSSRHPVAVGVYREDGVRVAGAGPSQSVLVVRAARTHRQDSGKEHGQLTLAVPVRTDRPGSAVVRVATPTVAVEHDVHEAWLLMAALGAAVVAAATGVAMLLARRVTRPLADLASAAHRLGLGDFTVAAPEGAFRETREVAAALDGSAQRIAGLIDRERAFSSNASHQMRTPLTALRLRLETASYDETTSVPQLVAEALPELDRLESTVDQLLSLTRDVEPVGALVDPAEVVRARAGAWEQEARRRARSLDVACQPQLPPVRASVAGLQHALDVLVDNALVHGAGQVTVRVRLALGGVAFDVTDEGSGIDGDPERVFRRRNPEAAGTGIGLALARALIEADGGRLRLVRDAGQTTFSVLLPVGTDLPHEAGATHGR